MKNILLLIIIFLFVVIELQCQIKNKTAEKLSDSIFYLLDNCLDNDVKESIKRSDKQEFIYSCSYDIINEIDWKKSNKNSNCFDVIDTLIHVDTNFVNYFNDLLDEFGSLINEVINKCYYQYLSGIKYNFAKEIDSLRVEKRKYDDISSKWLIAKKIKGYYIPKDLDDALNELNKILRPKDVKRFKNYKNENEASIKEHFGIGICIRNRWQLGGSRLHSYFAALGVQNHDRISSIILTAWYRKLHNESTNIDDLLIEARKYEAEDKIHALEYKNRYKRKDTKENITEPNKIK